MATQKWDWVRSIVLTLMAMAGSTFAQSFERFSFAEPHLGTIVEITIYAPEQGVANEAARSAFARVKELDGVFSDYKAESEVMRLCADARPGRPIKVSSELFQVLKQSLAVSEQTDGAFDVTVGPLVTLWRRARKEKRLPTDDQIARAKELVGWKLVLLNEADQTVELKRSGMRLDFGGIAKGFIAQDVNRLLRDRGLKRTLIAVAGDIVAGDPPPAAEGWRIAVAPLQGANGGSNRFLLLSNGAVSTSGDTYQFVEIGGVRYSHIVDPRTGRGLTRRSSVTIVAEDGGLADALATAVCVMGPERGLTLIDKQKTVDALIVQATDRGAEVFESNRFGRHEAK